MSYCPKCGSPVDGKFCPKCGAAVDPAAEASGGAAPPPAPPPGSPSLGMEENVAAALCYIPIVGLIFLLVEPYNKNRTVKFHALQSLFYCIAWIAVGIALGIITGIMFAIMPYGVWYLWLTVTRLIELALFIGLIIMAVKAYQKSRFLMPIIGPMAEKQAG